jgi:hypothetical protein
MFISYTQKILSFLLLFVLFISCSSENQKEAELRIEIGKAKELLYENQIDSAEQILTQIDTTILDQYGLALYSLTQSFLFHLKGDRVAASTHLRDCALYFDRYGSEEEKGEINLLNGFILESALLRAEAAQSYLNGLQFLGSEIYSDKYFKCLLGVIRTEPKGTDYLNEADEYVKTHPSNKNKLLYLSTQSTLAKTKREKLNLLLESLDYFDEKHHKRNLVRLYSNIAKTYQSINIKDSATFYILLAEKTIYEEEMEQQTLVHYYLIRAYIEKYTANPELSLLTLNNVFEMTEGKPGILAYASLLRSDINKSLGNFTEENHDLNEYIKYIRQEYDENKLHQIGLMKIQLELSKKELELGKTRMRWIISTLIFTIIVFVGWILFKRYQSRVQRKKSELEKLNELSSTRLKEQLNLNLNEIGRSILPIHEVSKNESISKIVGLNKQEFNTYFNIQHPFFREKLSAAYPLLSSTDMKYCDCILADLSVYQTTCILGVSESAVKKARKKLKDTFKCNSTHEVFLRLKKIDASAMRKAN